MSNIIDDLALYYDETIKFIVDNLMVFVLILIVLLLILSNTSLYVIKNNIDILVGLLIICLVLYILIVFYNKGGEYNDLKNFVDSRRNKINKLFDDINTNNNNFVKNDVDLCKKLKNIGSS